MQAVVVIMFCIGAFALEYLLSTILDIIFLDYEAVVAFMAGVNAITITVLVLDKLLDALT
mgnify:CR=1 FL=1